MSTVYFGTTYAGVIGDQSDESRYLLYVPTGPNDPLVTWRDNSADAFFAWTDSVGLARGAIAGKGAIDEPWQSDLDLRFQQEFPFFGDAKGKIYFDIENVLNLIDDSSGTKRYIDDTDIASAVALIAADYDPVADQYVYSAELDSDGVPTTFQAPTTTPDSWDSLWRIQVGIRVDF